ncbi:MAG: uracil-DNA glycosylase [Pirellulaceae bacterium]|nr:uracil-DNA glycosylase [Pirellulaceae bacterium]
MRKSSKASVSWKNLNGEICDCRRCDRLIEHCQLVAREKRAAYAEEVYWGKPVPNFGDASAKLLIVGLAPGAHGANRTGRMFTGDRSGLWLYRALHRAGFASQPTYESANDGQKLLDCAITAVCHCAPPGNKPTSDEIENCAGFFEQTWELTSPKVVLALGQIAWVRTFSFAKSKGWWFGKLPKFAHGATQMFETEVTVVGSYHPSQQNTFTGKLTEKMLDSVLAKVRQIANIEID